VNIIANQEVFPELLQEKAASKDIAEKMIRIINDENYNNHIKKQLKVLQQTIGEAGASKKIAKFILKV
jgi:lipid A disaccharide synthetase